MFRFFFLTMESLSDAFFVPHRSSRWVIQLLGTKIGIAHFSGADQKAVDISHCR